LEKEIAMQFFPEIPLNQNQAEAIARGLFALAKADGVHESEISLIAAFWGETGGSDRALSDLSNRDDITAEELSSALPSKELRQIFLRTALLLAFSDGEVSAKESEVVLGYCESLGLGADLPQMEEQVKEFLMGQLAHIHNTEALVKISKKLKITRPEGQAQGQEQAQS
jgi:tellurite resistance protein